MVWGKILVYTENHTKSIKQNAQILTAKLTETYSYHSALKGQVNLSFILSHITPLPQRVLSVDHQYCLTSEYVQYLQR
jgi:hypothetical protein